MAKYYARVKVNGMPTDTVIEASNQGAARAAAQAQYGSSNVLNVIDYHMSMNGIEEQRQRDDAAWSDRQERNRQESARAAERREAENKEAIRREDERKEANKARIKQEYRDMDAKYEQRALERKARQESRVSYSGGGGGGVAMPSLDSSDSGSGFGNILISLTVTVILAYLLRDRLTASGVIWFALSGLVLSAIIAPLVYLVFEAIGAFLGMGIVVALFILKWASILFALYLLVEICLFVKLYWATILTTVGAIATIATIIVIFYKDKEVEA